MTRYSFGGDLASWAYSVSGGNVVAATNAVVTFYTAETGGTQHTDLASNADGTGPISSVTTSNGGDGRPPGSIPRFWGPDGIALMWAAVGAGPRMLILATDGVPDGATLSTAQTFSKAKTFGPVGDVDANRIIVMAEATGQVGDLIVAYSGTDTGQGSARQRTFYLNEKGELRAISAKTNSVAVRIKGQTGQTADVFQQTDISNNPVSWMDAAGNWRAPNLGHILPFSIGGNLAVGAGAHRLYNDTGATLIIRAIRATVGTAPTGAAIRVDVNKNGTTLFTTQGNRPNIAIGTNTSKVTNMDVTTIADGDYLTCDVDAIGTGTVGADLVVQVLAY